MEVVALGCADFTIGTALSALVIIVKLVREAIKKRGQQREKQVLAAEVAQLVAFLDSDTYALQQRALQLDSPATPALGSVARIVQQQQQVLEEGLRNGMYSGYWRSGDAADSLRGVRAALVQAFSLGMVNASAQVGLDAQAEQRTHNWQLDATMGRVEERQCDMAAKQQETAAAIQALAASLAAGRPLGAAATGQATSAPGQAGQGPGSQQAQRLVAVDAVLRQQEKLMQEALAQFDTALRDRSSGGEFDDPVTSDLMVDPVVVDNGRTYCRWTIFQVQDYQTTLPGCADGIPRICCDNVDVRGRLFAAHPERQQEFRRLRSEHIGSISGLLSRQDFDVAEVRLQRALQWLSPNSPERQHLQSRLLEVQQRLGRQTESSVVPPAAHPAAHSPAQPPPPPGDSRLDVLLFVPGQRNVSRLRGLPPQITWTELQQECGRRLDVSGRLWLLVLTERRRFPYAGCIHTPTPHRLPVSYTGSGAGRSATLSLVLEPKVARLADWDTKYTVEAGARHWSHDQTGLDMQKKVLFLPLRYFVKNKGLAPPASLPDV